MDSYTKINFEWKMEMFTKYVNDYLRKHILVEHWGFQIDDDNRRVLIVCIDYTYNFHSRDMFILGAFDDLDTLKREFDYQFNRHLEEIKEKVV